MTSEAGIFDIDFWKNEPPDGIINLICFMPNGVVITIAMHSTSTIRAIKTEAVKQAKNFPLNHLIKDACDYEISGLTAYANIETFTDEKKLCEVQPYFCILRLNARSEATQISSNYELLKMVSDMIGKSCDDYNERRSTPEIEEFRSKMNELCDEIDLQRSEFTWHEMLQWEHPLRLANTPVMPDILRERLQSPNFLVVVRWEQDNSSYTIPANEHTTASGLISLTLDKLNRAVMKISNRLSEYVLKCVDREEYLFGKIPLVQFIFIQEVLAGKYVPNVVLKEIHKISSYENCVELRRQWQQNISRNKLKHDTDKNVIMKLPQEPQIIRSSWDIEEKFRFRLIHVKKVNFDPQRAIRVGVRVGLYHGEKKLCAQTSVDMEIFTDKKNDVIVFNKEISLDIEMLNLPRMARLCITIYEVTKVSRSKKSSNTNKKDNNIYPSTNETENPLAWVNMTVFDYKNQLRNSDLSLYTWTYADDIQTDEILNPLGTIEPNPQVNQCAMVQLKIHTYNCDAMYYPSQEVVMQYASELSKVYVEEATNNEKKLAKLVALCSGANNNYELHEQDRADIWDLRHEFKRLAPEELSILLRVVNWNDRDEVAELWGLLEQWPTIPVERSLKLLDYAYPDPAVRSFAIRCLRLQKDEDLLLYLLQLVQAIKHESYIDCDLVKFILERALRNQRIGHYFFWHLRSEMQTLTVQTRFGLLLETYLKGSKPHVPLLQKQLDALNTLKKGSEMVKKGGKDKVRASLQNFLLEKNECLQKIKNPLNPSFRCKGVKPDKCKVMDSKMRPLWIVFENTDDKLNDIYIIFKNGDDLRQDMLTLQMLRVMDQLWKNEGMDLRMNIYNCISMERRLGMIEVVLNAETIANIQKVKGMFSATSPFKKGSLYSWLKEFNKTEEELNKAVMEFTLSCAGYCVATYVLGVADRHSDNIMVKQNGQLFHIDFGHILGHFKEKFGVRRERVPFVLTHDFVYVISKGRADRESEEFRQFEEICQKAFLILRKHGCLILSLFSMMISTGLPELSSGKDLNYLRETLVLDITEDQARDHFKSKFSEALANSWKTSLNWASHNFSKNNKQ